MARSLLRTVPDWMMLEPAPALSDWEPTGVERPRPEPQTGPVATPAPFCIWGEGRGIGGRPGDLAFALRPPPAPLSHHRNPADAPAVRALPPVRRLLFSRRPSTGRPDA